jgi:hypothetical protein
MLQGETRSYSTSVSRTKSLPSECHHDTDKHPVHQSLAPFLVTIDGKDPPAAFYGEWTPWIVQSPLMSSVTILSASCYQSEVRGLDVAKCTETIAIQGKIISVINEYLRKKKLKEVGYDAIAAVMYLAMNEVGEQPIWSGFEL